MSQPEINKAGAQHIVGRLKGMQVRVIKRLRDGDVHGGEALVNEMEGLVYVLGWNTANKEEAKQGRAYLDATRFIVDNEIIGKEG